jgi:oligopeptide/dipeptide ABC transporter ATP-binding protein
MSENSLREPSPRFLSGQAGQALLLKVRNLKTYFFLREGIVRAVDGANFEVGRGRTLGIIGESGCGKSVTALSILRIVPHPGRTVEGEVQFHRSMRRNGSGEVTQVVDLAKLDPRGSEIRSIRGAEIAMVFQEPMSSLTPVYTIGDQIMETILLHQEINSAQAREGAIEMLDRVGMPKPSQTVDSYPHQLSGGMRQRAMIAMALSCNPSLLIADEPTTALDVTTEAQILELMRDLQQELGMSIMYITHDLGVIAEMAEDVVVMYLGKIVERADVVSLFHDPQHPYTQALLKSIPKIGRKSRQRLASIKGMVPDPYALPEGCLFHPRCPEYMEGICDQQDPRLSEVKKGHWASCLLFSP